jgi:hypothetical protein
MKLTSLEIYSAREYEIFISFDRALARLKIVGFNSIIIIDIANLVNKFRQGGYAI